ncbi:hypothetical protein F5146DRAFT_1120177 [Armillaria mellea]|nr:hypothetical protein F5146DRAFT_1120177 [Armillaria mellea]
MLTELKDGTRLFQVHPSGTPGFESGSRDPGLKQLRSTEPILSLKESRLLQTFVMHFTEQTRKTLLEKTKQSLSELTVFTSGRMTNSSNTVDPWDAFAAKVKHTSQSCENANMRGFHPIQIGGGFSQNIVARTMPDSALSGQPERSRLNVRVDYPSTLPRKGVASERERLGAMWMNRMAKQHLAPSSLPTEVIHISMSGDMRRITTSLSPDCQILRA